MVWAIIDVSSIIFWRKLIYIWQSDDNIFDPLPKQGLGFLDTIGKRGNTGYAFLSYLFSDLYYCLKEGFFGLGGLVSWLSSMTAITRLFLGTGLDTGSGRFARLGRDVLLTDSFVLLTVSINLEKEENVRFSYRHSIHLSYHVGRNRPAFLCQLHYNNRVPSRGIF